MKNEDDFMGNVEFNVKKLSSSIDSDVNCHACVGPTQIGKQLISIKTGLVEFSKIVPWTQNGGSEQFFFCFDIGCLSDTNVQQQKKKRWEEALGAAHSWERIHDFWFAGHMNELDKAMKESKYGVKCLEFMSIKEDKVVKHSLSMKDLVTFFSNTKLKVNILLMCDEAHQYKNSGGSLHKFLRDIVKIDLRTGEHSYNSCNFVPISATLQDIISFILEQPEPSSWNTIYWSPPSNYCGLADLILHDRVDDSRVYLNKLIKTNPDKYKNWENDSQVEKELHHDGVLYTLRMHQASFDNSSSQIFPLRHPNDGKEETARLYEDLTKQLKKLYPDEKRRPIILQADQEHPEDVKKFESLLEETGLSPAEEALLAISDASGRSILENQKYIVLMKNKYAIGQTIPMHNIYAWFSPYKSQTHSTLSQDIGRTCGPNKLNDGHILITDLRMVEQIIDAEADFANTGDPTKLSHLSSHQHKLLQTRMKREYEAFCISKSDPLYTDHLYKGIGKSKLRRPYKLSTRAKNNKHEFSPDELILKALEESISEGLTAFPIEHGGETNCLYNGQEVYAMEIDGASLNCPTDKKVEIEKLHGQVFIQMKTGNKIKNVVGSSVSELSPSKKSKNMLSEYLTPVLHQ